jgi:hypothetical protein
MSMLMADPCLPIQRIQHADLRAMMSLTETTGPIAVAVPVAERPTSRRPAEGFAA